MWPFTRKKKSVQLYRCTYCLSSKIDGDEVRFDLRDKSELILSANSREDAQVLLAKKISLAPHVYIHDIKKMMEVEI